MEKVDVLLATYQGAKYLEEQLKSIFTQTYSSIHLWIRDDGSSDQTFSILQRWAQTYPDKITLLPSEKRLGIIRNFSKLMEMSSAPYVMLADQDDKWLPNKVEISLAHLKAMERQYGPFLPLLVHTDLRVVDQNLQEIAPSFWRYSGINPNHTSLNRLLTQNIITGCTMLMNRALIDAAYPISSDAIMHDWWIALVASCLGRIWFVDQPTLLYRQHDANDVGAKFYNIWRYLSQTIREKRKQLDIAQRTYQQADELWIRYHQILSVEKQFLIKIYKELEKLPCLRKKYLIIKHQFFKQGFLRNIKMLLNK